MLEGASVWVWDFDKEVAGKAPPGFTFSRTGNGKLGRWVVQDEKGAPSGSHVLAQLDSDDTDYRFPIAVANEPLLRNLRLSVRCKPVSGKVDQACGLVFRYRDENNYYDMYEHSYHMDYGAKAAAYVDAFMNNINWGNVSRLHHEHAPNK